VPFTYTTYDKEPLLIVGFGLDFQKIRIFPEHLSGLEVDAMFFQIGFAFVVVELEIIHEYKLCFFYSFDKMVEEW
jgi:hypothetical protein